MSASAVVEAMEEEDYNIFNGADPWCRLEDTVFSLSDGILLYSIVTTMRRAATMSLLAISVVTVHWAGELGGRHWQQRCDGGQGA